MRPIRIRSLCCVVAAFLLAACGVQMGDESARTPVTGSAGGATSQNANAKLEHCDQSLGTLAVIEDQTAPWYYRLTREYKLTSTVPLIRLLVQQSNCFVVVERGRAFGQMQTERALNQAGELRQGSNFGQGQIVAAEKPLESAVCGCLPRGIAVRPPGREACSDRRRCFHGLLIERARTLPVFAEPGGAEPAEEHELAGTRHGALRVPARHRRGDESARAERVCVLADLPGRAAECGHGAFPLGQHRYEPIGYRADP